MLGFDIFYSPWGDQTDYFFNILGFIMFAFCIYLLILNRFNKNKFIKFSLSRVPVLIGLFNCIPMILLDWFMAAPLIILESTISWFAYTTDVDRYARRQIKNIEFTNRLLMEEQEDEYDSSHTKEELEVIKRQAHKYPRMGITKFLFVSFITPILFFITLLLLGYKYIP